MLRFRCFWGVVVSIFFIILAVLRRGVLRARGAHLHVIAPGNTAPFEEMLRWWRAVGNTVFNLTGPRFEPQTSRSRDERVTVRPTGRRNQIYVKISRSAIPKNLSSPLLLTSCFTGHSCYRLIRSNLRQLKAAHVLTWKF